MVIANGIVPFLIDWGDTPHPSQNAVQGLALTGFRAEHPEAKATRHRYRSPKQLTAPVVGIPVLADNQKKTYQDQNDVKRLQLSSH